MEGFFTTMATWWRHDNMVATWRRHGKNRPMAKPTLNYHPDSASHCIEDSSKGTAVKD